MPHHLTISHQYTYKHVNPRMFVCILSFNSNTRLCIFILTSLLYTLTLHVLFLFLSFPFYIHSCAFSHKHTRTLTHSHTYLRTYLLTGLLLFYLFFHCWLNICGELLRFGDRQFYRDWWGARIAEGRNGIENVGGGVEAGDVQEMVMLVSVNFLIIIINIFSYLSILSLSLSLSVSVSLHFYFSFSLSLSLSRYSIFLNFNFVSSHALHVILFFKPPYLSLLSIFLSCTGPSSPFRVQVECHFDFLLLAQLEYACAQMGCQVPRMQWRIGDGGGEART